MSKYFDCPRITCGPANLWAVTQVICGRIRHNVSFKIEEHEKADEHIITPLHRYSGQIMIERYILQKEINTPSSREASRASGNH